jgi:hypothetical protein
MTAARDGTTGEPLWRRIPASLLAPATLVAIDVLSRGDQFATGQVDRDTYFEGVLPTLIGLIYIGSGIAALVAWGLIAWLHIPRRSWAVMLVFGGVCAAMTALLLPAPFLIRISGSLVFGFVASLPISLAYCLIAGVPWRAQAQEAATGGSKA